MFGISPTRNISGTPLAAAAGCLPPPHAVRARGVARTIASRSLPSPCRITLLPAVLDRHRSAFGIEPRQRPAAALRGDDVALGGSATDDGTFTVAVCREM